MTWFKDMSMVCHVCGVTGGRDRSFVYECAGCHNVFCSTHGQQCKRCFGWFCLEEIDHHQCYEEPSRWRKAKITVKTFELSDTAVPPPPVV